VTGFINTIKQITWYRNALQDPSICINSAQYRPIAADVLDELLELIFADPVLYNLLRMQLLQRCERDGPSPSTTLKRMSGSCGGELPLSGSTQTFFLIRDLLQQKFVLVDNVAFRL
jgi:hypothetical protein